VGLVPGPWKAIISSQTSSHAAFSGLLDRAGEYFQMRSDAPLWTPEQASSGFFSASLIFDHIIASTTLPRPSDVLRMECYSSVSEPQSPHSQPCLQLENFFGCQDRVLIAMGEVAAVDV
jgi:hypothetical protein